jgi:hypothetical protein
MFWLVEMCLGFTWGSGVVGFSAMAACQASQHCCCCCCCCCCVLPVSVHGRCGRLHVTTDSTSHASKQAASPNSCKAGHACEATCGWCEAHGWFQHLWRHAVACKISHDSTRDLCKTSFAVFFLLAGRLVTLPMRGETAALLTMTTHASDCTCLRLPLAVCAAVLRASTRPSAVTSGRR